MNSQNYLKKIPTHLAQYISNQQYNMYTALDHAGWRYIMRVSKAFFKDHAHKKYLTGLELTGVTTERIPKIEEMDAKLKRFGWRAITVKGFIPPTAFLEFQSLSVLPIACDMREIQHIEYTPSPDIVHEAAGHAPIISDKKYASYLHKFGEIARKAIFAKEDLAVYEAIKYLSDIKENPKTTQAEVDKAYLDLEAAKKKVRYVSEAAKLSRLGWWSIEYGLVKNISSRSNSKSDRSNYKIYGAGLLSSVGESYNAIHANVKKVRLTLNCVDTDYDITKPQPQLFYVNDFNELEKVIAQLSLTMAYKLGGAAALERGLESGTITTSVLNSNLQMSGILSAVYKTKAGEPYYLQFVGPTQLAHFDKEIKGHSKKYHASGFGTPIGKIKNSKKSTTQLTLNDLKKMGFEKNKNGRLEFESGVVVEGEYVSCVKVKGKNLILSFKNTKVFKAEKVFFEPSWGMFDMGCGETVISVFGGAADRGAYDKPLKRIKGPAAKKSSADLSDKKQTSNLTNENRKLVLIYRQIREMRERLDINRVGGVKMELFYHKLEDICNKLDNDFRGDWLARLEAVELLSLLGKRNSELFRRVSHQLLEFKIQSKSMASLIQRGLDLVSTPRIGSGPKIKQD